MFGKSWIENVGSQKPMKKSCNKIFAVLVGALLLAPVAFGSVHAEEYPSRTIKIIVPFPPGGNPDLAARLVAQHMAVQFGQSVIIENKTGANGSIGATTVAKADPDGYTLLVANLGILGINPGVRENLSYNVSKDFVPINRLAISPLVLIASPALKVNSVKDLIALAKEKPGSISYGSAGVGSAAHMSGELFDQLAGTKMLHIPYKGASETATAVAGNTISIVFGGQGASFSLVAAGKVKALAMTGEKRSPTHPDLPTIAEAGVPGYAIADWVGMLAPAGTPQPIIDKLNAAVQKALADPDTQKKFALQGLEPAGTTPKEFSAFVEAEQKKWAAVAKKSNIRIKQ